MVREFTPQEKDKLVQFRKQIPDLLKSPIVNDDYYLIRWLRARSLDLPKAEEMLRASLKWREKEKVDNILIREADLIPEEYKKIYPTGLFGEDKEGNPIVYLPLGRFNHKVAISKVGLPTFLRYNIIWAEEIMKRVRDTEERLGKKGLQMIEIIDMEYYSFKELTYKPGREFIIESQKIFEANYPEMLKSMLIINAPKIFAMAFSIFRPLLPKETLEKMDIYGMDEESWKSVMRQKGCPLENIPERWGGTLKGGDIFCSQDNKVWMDGPLYLTYFTQEEVDEEGLTKVKVGARDKLKIGIKVSSKQSELRYKFKTEGHDIGFQITCPKGTNPVEWNRVEFHEGSISCDNVGNYQLLFDNSFSYTRSKVVFYSVSVDTLELDENPAQTDSTSLSDNEDANSGTGSSTVSK